MEYSILEGGDWVCKSIANTMGTEGGGKSIANTKYSGVGSSKKRANITYIIKKMLPYCLARRVLLQHV